MKVVVCEKVSKWAAQIAWVGDRVTCLHCGLPLSEHRTLDLPLERRVSPPRLTQPETPFTEEAT